MRTISFTRHRFPPDIIRHTVWLYARFNLSYRDVEDLLAKRGLDISHETVRHWFPKNLRADCSKPAPHATDAQRLLAIEKPETRREIIIRSLGKRTPENAAELCRLIERGVPHTVAAEAVGMHRDTLRSWRDDDPEFDALVAAARMGAISRKIQRIDEAGERRDWKADSWYLERAPETRDVFAGSTNKGNADIQVILNIGDPKPVEIPVIDVTPVSAR